MLYVACGVSVAMVTGEVPPRAGEAEAGVGESAEGGGRGGAQVPRRGGTDLKNSLLLLRELFFWHQ